MTAQSLKKISQFFPLYAVKNVVDVGANVGQSSLEVLDLCPGARVYAVEPAPEAFAVLMANCSGNSNISFHQALLSSSTRTLALRVQGDSPMNRIQLEGTTGGLLVVSTTLDDFVTSEKLDEISLIKVDTEGHDLEVLKGGRAQALALTDFVEVEVSLNNYNRYHVGFSEVLDFMWREGFFLFDLNEIVREWQGGGYPVLRRANALFVSGRVIGPLDGVDHK